MLTKGPNEFVNGKWQPTEGTHSLTRQESPCLKKGTSVVLEGIFCFDSTQMFCSLCFV